MRRITYAGTWFDTGDDIAEALLYYAKALAYNNVADTVAVPGRSATGDAGIVEVIIGPASQIVSAPIEFVGESFDDPAVIAELERKTSSLQPRRPLTEPEVSTGGEAPLG
ncbi:hypothetical protein [Leifsonia sp. SIMBA_070]|uniref:hypothetical protein n=1 Tax=Leifsonia sp. SIMBA_070 TaxID=3085810 RepID=UPI00397BAF87